MNTNSSFSFLATAFVISWYGSQQALGGKPEDLKRVCNVLHNHFGFEGEVQEVHQDFGYLTTSPENLLKAFKTIALIDAPKPYGRDGFKEANQRAVDFFFRIPKENFLIGQNARRQLYGARVEAGAVCPASADQELDWKDAAVLSGVNRVETTTH